MKNIKIPIITLVILIIIGIAGFFFFKYTCNQKKLNVVLKEIEYTQTPNNPNGPNMGYITYGAVYLYADEQTINTIFDDYPDAQDFVVTLSFYQDNNLVKEFSHKHVKDVKEHNTENGCYYCVFGLQYSGLKLENPYTTKLKLEIANDVLESEEIEISMTILNSYNYTYSIE